MSLPQKPNPWCLPPAPPVREFYVPSAIQLPDGRIVKAGDILRVSRNSVAEGVTTIDYTILSAAPGTPPKLAGHVLDELKKAVREQDERNAREVAELLEAGIPEVKTKIRPGGFDKQLIVSFDPEEKAPALSGNSRAAYPRIVENKTQQPCYVCAVRPHKIPVARLERSKDDFAYACGHCILHVLGYTGFEADGHLTRNPADS